MKVLVAYASRYGSTKGIAEFITERLLLQQVEADILKIDGDRDLGGYDAFVIGSAVYMFHWLKEATEFVSRNREILASRPVWLFSSGPLGTNTKDAKGRDLRDVSGPSELGELTKAIKPRGTRVFFGALDSSKLGFGYRVIRKMPAAREALAEGDFRNWEEIEAWANSIAQELKGPQASPH